MLQIIKALYSRKTQTSKKNTTFIKYVVHTFNRTSFIYDVINLKINNNIKN